MAQALPPPRSLPPPLGAPYSPAVRPSRPVRPQPLPALEGQARRVVLVELAVMSFMLAVPSLVFGLQGIGGARQIETDLSYLEVATSVLAGLGPAVLCGFLLWRDGVLQRSMFGPRGIGFTMGWGALTFVCIFGAAIVGGLLIVAIQNALGSDAASNVQADTDLTVRYAIVAVALSLTAGISEEAVWRAYGTARMQQAGFPRAALIAPSVVWVLLHLYGGPYTLLGVTFIGAPIVWMAWWKRSVWPLMLAHAAWDVVAFLAATIDPDEAIVRLLIRRH